MTALGTHDAVWFLSLDEAKLSYHDDVAAMAAAELRRGSSGCGDDDAAGDDAAAAGAKEGAGDDATAAGDYAAGDYAAAGGAKDGGDDDASSGRASGRASDSRGTTPGIAALEGRRVEGSSRQTPATAAGRRG